jgi:methyltransferase (TIGR00027 family)
MDERSSRPSLTAALVAFARGAASHPPLGARSLRDDVARSLLPAPLSALLPRTDGFGARVAQAALRVATGGLVDHLALRSLAIDEAVSHAIRAGVHQLVILGAGLDARAYRLDGLEATTVYEVDHPASQSYKRARTARRAPSARRVVHVDVDFSRQTTDDRLAACGHDRDEPTAWICEGVTMYLERGAVFALLDQVERASAADSVFAITYRSAGEAPFPTPIMAVVGASVAAVGEPFHAPISPREMASWLDERGFDVHADESSTDWAPRFGGSSTWPRLFRSERLVVGRKR